MFMSVLDHYRHSYNPTLADQFGVDLEFVEDPDDEDNQQIQLDHTAEYIKGLPNFSDEEITVQFENFSDGDEGKIK